MSRVFDTPPTTWLSLEEAAAEFPGTPSVQAVRGWARVGVKTPWGRIKLRAIKSGGRWFTTELWCRQFIEDQTMAATETPATLTTRDGLTRRREIDLAERSRGEEANEEAGRSMPLRLREAGSDEGAVVGLLPGGQAADRSGRRPGGDGRLLDRERADLTPLPELPVGLPFRLGRVAPAKADAAAGE